MSDKKITIKEIANLAGVSVGTVHSALHNKPGINEKTRERVLKVAEENNYRVNAAAAALKRKPKKVVVAVPQLDSVNRYYFRALWDALEEYENRIYDSNISFVKVPYMENDPKTGEILLGLAAEDEIAGVISFSTYLSAEGREALWDFFHRGKPVVLIGEEDSKDRALCTVTPDYEMLGRVAGELLMRELKSSGKIVICAGEETNFSHYGVVNGIVDFFQKNHLPNQIIRKHYFRDAEDHYGELLNILKPQEELAACVAVTARESYLLGRALQESQLAGKVLAIGSDIFEENITFLEEEVFTNLLNKNPYIQMRMALKNMESFLATGIRPEKSVIYVNTEVVFKSSLPMYKNEEKNRLL